MDVEIRENESMFHTLSMLCMLTQTVSCEHGAFEKIYNKTFPTETTLHEAHMPSSEDEEPLNTKTNTDHNTLQAINNRRASEWKKCFDLSNAQ